MVASDGAVMVSGGLPSGGFRFQGRLGLVGARIVRAMEGKGEVVAFGPQVLAFGNRSVAGFEAVALGLGVLHCQMQ